MKNLLIFTGPHKRFDKEHEILARIQIDNLLDLGWERKDIIVATDFKYSYNGVNTEILPDDLYYHFDNSSNKICVIKYLLRQNLLDPNELYWYHDFDVYQQYPIEECELGLNFFDLGITPYGYKPQWNLGSIFFKTKAFNHFNLIDETIINRRKSDNRCDEKALKRLIVEGKIKTTEYKELNVTYNFTKRCIATNYRYAEKPLKVLHFHLWDKDLMMNDTALNIFMHGKNRLKTRLMNNRLIKIFNHHGIK